MPAPVYLFEPPLPLPCSPRAIAIAQHFGVLDATVGRSRVRRLGPLDRAPIRPSATPRRSAERLPIASPTPGQILLLSGASGSGKSSLLRAIRKHVDAEVSHHVIDLRRIPLPERPVVDLFDDERNPTADADPLAFAPILRRLARVGLAEVWTWLRPPSQLSEGQRWRLRVALATHAIDRLAGSTSSGQSPRRALLVCDEFAAVLDRVSAFVIAGVIRRFVDARADRVAALLATSHDDVRRPLDPDLIARCDFGTVVVQRRRRTPRSGAEGITNA